MKDRIVKFIAEEQLSAAEFADHIGVQRSSVSHVLNGRNNPSFAFIQKILDNYPRLNPRWLLTGQGEIYEDKNQLIKQSKPVEQKLFSTQDDESKKNANIHSTPKEESSSVIINEIPTASASANLVETKMEKKVTRVLIFYDDHTFEDFRPAK